MTKRTENMGETVAAAPRAIPTGSRKPTCFVIMPFSRTRHASRRDWRLVYEELLEPAVQACDYVCYRVPPEPGAIIGKILGHLDAADVVLADITDNNANVLWELGVRHGRVPGTVMVSHRRFKGEIPFDLQGHTIERYSVGWLRERPRGKRLDAARKDLERRLGCAFGLLRARPAMSDNPVADHDGESRRAAIWPKLPEARIADLVDNAESEVFILSHTLERIAYTGLRSIAALLKSGKSIKIAITDPRPRNRGAHSIMDDYSSVSFRPIIERVANDWATWWNKLHVPQRRLVQIRVAPLLPAGYFFVDGDTDRGVLHIVPLMANGDPSARMAVSIERRIHPAAFELYYQRFNEWFNDLPPLPRLKGARELWK